MSHISQNNYAFLNGDFLNRSFATDLFNQKSHNNLAAYEEIRAYNTHNGVRLFKPKEHLMRLQRSCDLLGIESFFDVYSLIDRTYDLLGRNRLRNAYVEIIASDDSSIFITADEWNYFLPSQPLRLTISEFERPNPRSIALNAKIKGDIIYKMLPTKKANSKGFDEALLLDMNGNIAQSPSANVFFEIKGKLYTPAKGHIFPGITRSVVIKICKAMEIEVVEKDLTLNDVLDADAAFLCGTRTEIVGISSIDSLTFPEEWNNTVSATIQRIFISRVLEQENYEVII